MSHNFSSTAAARMVISGTTVNGSVPAALVRTHVAVMGIVMTALMGVRVLDLSLEERCEQAYLTSTCQVASACVPTGILGSIVVS